MKKLIDLVGLCNYSITIEINAHRDVRMSAEMELQGQDDLRGTDIAVIKEMISSNRIVRIKAFPRNEIVPCVVYHYDVDKAVTEMLKKVKAIK